MGGRCLFYGLGALKFKFFYNDFSLLCGPVGEPSSWLFYILVVPLYKDQRFHILRSYNEFTKSNISFTYNLRDLNTRLSKNCNLKDVEQE